MSTSGVAKTLQPGPRFDPSAQTDIRYSLFDIDDTLVSQHSRELPSPRFLAAAHHAGKYALLGVVSARSLPKAGHIMNAAHMKGLSILNNGAQVYDGESGLMKVERPLPITATAEILHLLQAGNIDHDVQDNGIDYMWQTIDGVGHYFRKKHVDQPFSSDNQLLVPTFSPHKPFFIAVHHLTPDEITEMRGVSQQYQDQHVTVHTVHEYIHRDKSKTYDIFFADDRADKQTALQIVSELSDMDIANIMMTGDGLNDRGIVGNAGVGVAMGNAADETKQVATFIAPARQHNGAAVALEDLVIAGRK